MLSLGIDAEGCYYCCELIPGKLHLLRCIPFVLPLIASAQFSGLSTKEMSAIPFDRMKLIVPITAPPAVQSLLDSVLRADWTLTPEFQLLDTSLIDDLRSDSMLLFLDLYHVSLSAVSESKQSEYRDVHHPPTGSYPAFTSKERVPGSSTVYSVYEVAERSSLSISGSLVGLKTERTASFGSTFNIEFPRHERNVLREGAWGITRGGGGPRERRGRPLMMKDYDLVVFSPLDHWVREVGGVQDRYRLSILVRGLQDGVEVVRERLIPAGFNAAVNAQEQFYRSRRSGFSGKLILLPRKWLHGSEQAWFTARFNGQLELADPERIARALATKDQRTVLLLPMGERLLFYDMGTGELIYCYDDANGLDERDVEAVYITWKAQQNKKIKEAR